MLLQIRVLVATGLLLAVPLTATAQNSCLDVIDFETHAEGANISSTSGTNGTGPVGVRATNPLFAAGVNAAVIFDSACNGGCSGGDADLGTPNIDFGGPGSGAGGALGAPGENAVCLNNHLIVAEDLIDSNGDGLVDDPDDQGDQPVSMRFDFSEVGKVTLHELTLVDVESKGEPGRISLLDGAGGTLLEVAAPVTGNNGVAIVDLLDTDRVNMLALDLAQSSAVDNIVFSVSCDDGNPCTEDLCVGGDCVNLPIDGCVRCDICGDCNDDTPCTDDICTPEGVCANINNTAPCDDGVFCNGADNCFEGECSAHDGDPCPFGTRCSEELDSCPALECSQPDDPSCDDGNPCTHDSCDLAAGLCVNENNQVPCDDGVYCNGDDTCADGACSVHAGDPCANGSECSSTCNETTGSCFAQAGTTCTDDGNVCTDNICDGEGACVAENNASACDDGLFCNGADTCLNGDCLLHAGDPCSAGEQCRDTCDDTADSCLTPAGTGCSDDGNPCTDNICDGLGSCTAQPNTAPCEDGDACTGPDTCADGSCVPGSDPCPPDTVCIIETGVCEALECTVADDVACDDSNPCTNDFCDLAANACINESNTAPCDDGIFCNGEDTCADGACSVHAGDPCTAGGECADTCDENADTCFLPAGTGCADDGNGCTDNLCDGAGSCIAEANNTACDDGIYCNGEDTCAASACSVHAGDPCAGAAECADQCDEVAASCFSPAGLPCTDDGNVCTDDICDGLGACTAQPNMATCDDGVFCNGADICMDGTCSAHTGDPCAEGETCNEETLSCDSGGCNSGLRLIVEDVTCALNATCAATITLASDGLPVASALATLEADGAFTCGPSCQAGTAAASGSCFLNPTNCRFIVADGIPPITAFADGEIATVDFTCEQPGTFSIGLREDFSIGNDSGGVLEGACVSAGTLTCTNDQLNNCIGPGEGGSCDDGLFCNGVESCDGTSCVPGTPPCSGGCDEASQQCIEAPGCVNIGVGSGVSCPAGGDCIVPVLIETGSQAVGAAGLSIDAGVGLSCNSCAPGEGAAGASCAVAPSTCQVQVAALSAESMPLTDGVIAEVAVSCAAPTSGLICPSDIEAFGPDGFVELSTCQAECVPYACTPENQLCSAEADCDDNVECTVDCCAFDPATSTLECQHEDNECSGCADGPRLAGIDTICTVGQNCQVAVQVESGIDPIASISAALTADTGLTLEGFALGGCTATSQTTSLDSPPLFSMAAPAGTAYCDGDALIATVRCEEEGIKRLTPTGVTLGDDGLPLPMPICGGCGAAASVVCVQPGMLFPCGDANLEGHLTVTDSLIMLRHTTGYGDPCPMSVCDVDDSGAVTANDAVESLFGAIRARTLTCGNHATATVSAGAAAQAPTSTSSTSSTTLAATH